MLSYRIGFVKKIMSLNVVLSDIYGKCDIFTTIPPKNYIRCTVWMTFSYPNPVTPYAFHQLEQLQHNP